jgi:ABC-type cobalamin/Fe3+-siderophores transport system ATPase subunit
MKIEKLSIRGYRNINNVAITIDGDQSILMLAGKNGCGKSNIITSILNIFRHLKGELTVIDFEYDIQIFTEESRHTFSYSGNKIKHNGGNVDFVPAYILPENIIFYYSGHNAWAHGLVRESEEIHKKRVRGLARDKMRWLIGINETSRDIAVLILLLQEDGSGVRSHVRDRLDIISVDKYVTISLKSPYFFDGVLDSWESNAFWGCSGYVRDFLNKLNSYPTPPERQMDAGYMASDGVYQIVLRVESLMNFLKTMTPVEFFKFFDDLRIIGMLNGVELPLMTTDAKTIYPRDMSDGELQAAFISCCVEIFSQKNCLFLLDEPDSFLHPEWQSKMAKQLSDLASVSAGGNQIIMTTHQAATAVQAPSKTLQLMSKNKRVVTCRPANKEFLIKELTSGLYVLNKEMEILSVIKSIQRNESPILFTEGFTDVLILETAWANLYTSEIPFKIMHAFCCKFLYQLLQNDQVHSQRGGQSLFGLFDFDDAFDLWNGLPGDVVELNPCNGLCKKLKFKNTYAYVVPIPQQPAVEAMVFKDKATLDHHGSRSRVSIEHVFYGSAQTLPYFTESLAPGGGKIVEFMESKKTEFAADVVPRLGKDAFLPFSALFKSILLNAGKSDQVAV